MIRRKQPIYWQPKLQHQTVGLFKDTGGIDRHKRVIVESIYIKVAQTATKLVF
jgi:hypothetical protein